MLGKHREAKATFCYLSHSHTENMPGVEDTPHKGKLERGQLRTSSHPTSAPVPVSLQPIPETSLCFLSPEVRLKRVGTSQQSCRRQGRALSFPCCWILLEPHPQASITKASWFCDFKPALGVSSCWVHGRPQDTPCAISQQV